jgi:FixJ family two-component response regulator
MSSPNRNLVFVIDDDPGMLKAIALLLRHHGYDSMLFPSAEAFEGHSEFDNAICVLLDINLNANRSGIELRDHLAAAGVTLPSFS